MDKVVLINFFAEWCGACKAQDPILEELRRTTGNKVDIIKVDVSENRDMVREFKVEATPTMFIIKDNNILRKYVGVTSRNELESMINNITMFNAA